MAGQLYLVRLPHSGLHPTTLGLGRPIGNLVYDQCINKAVGPINILCPTWHARHKPRYKQAKTAAPNSSSVDDPSPVKMSAERPRRYPLMHRETSRNRTCPARKPDSTDQPESESHPHPNPETALVGSVS